MKVLITGITVCDPTSAYNGKKIDLLIQNGKIETISGAGKLTTSGVKRISGTGLFISPGFVDMRASLGEPGYEYKENLVSGANAASAGGYTTITCLPDTLPVIQHKADIEFILRRSAPLPVAILPYGAITKNRDGKELNELYDMHAAGAVGFTDGNRTIMQAGVMERAMEYSTIFNGLVIAHAEDTSISGSGQMHEGVMSTSLGLKGIPNMAEELIVNRDIELARYTKAPVHIAHISSAGSVELIRKAKKSGLKITCDVAVPNLIWTDEELYTFDSNFKLNPPLREASDRKALWNGLKDGTIDCIVTDHKPEDTEHKDLEFEYASPGMIQFQTAFALLNKQRPSSVSLDVIISALTAKPRSILKQPEVSIRVGALAELTLFSTDKQWTFTAEANHSNSKNSPLLNSTLTGKVIATIHNDQLFLHS